jgi:hypothetical protein
MPVLKHIGRITKTGAKVLVAFRTLPGESNYALVIPVAGLSDSYHDAIMKVVESDQAQETFEFGEILFIRSFPDGRPMLQALKADGDLQKVPTDSVTMTPTPNDNIELHQLNVLIAEQRNCAVDDLCKFVSGAPNPDAQVEDVAKISEVPKTEEVLGRDIGEPRNVPEPLKAPENQALTDKDIAKSYRSQADAMYKEAARLRREADELDPPQKKTVKSKETLDA